MGPRGGVVTQRSAKPCTPVQFWSWPPALIIDFIRVFSAWLASGKASFLHAHAHGPNGRQNAPLCTVLQEELAIPRQMSAHRAASAGGWFAVGAEFEGTRSACCPGGSRARAMLMRQPDCEVEIVPSLHSNLGGVASATGAGFSSAAACCGATAAGFPDKAQPAHQREINTATPIRIRVASRALQRPVRIISTSLAVYELPPAYNGRR